MSKKITETDAITTLAADDILVLVDYDVTTTRKMTLDGFLAFIPAGVNVGLGVNSSSDGWERYGLAQQWNTGTPPTDWGCGGTSVVVIFDPTADGNNDAYGINSSIRPTTSAPSGGYPLSDVTSVRGYAYSPFRQTQSLTKSLEGSFEARQYGAAVGSIYAVLAQATNLSYYSGNTTTIHGIYADAYTSISAGSVAVGTLYGTELRTFGKTNVAGTTSAVTTAYGLYSSLYCQQEAASTSTIGTAYNIYLTDLRPGGGIDYGPVTTYYGLYIVEPTKATTNYAIYVNGRSHFDQPTNDAAVPVLALDQADLSEGFIDYLGTSGPSAVGPVSSWTSGNSIQGFVRVEINGTAYWMPYYDAPTS